MESAMLKRFLRWLFGYLYITLKGNYPEHFMNLCESRNILLWSMVCEKGQCSCYIRLRDYRNLKEIAKKTKTIPYIKKRYGFPFLVKRIRKRKVYFIGILLFCLLLFTMSKYIWDISIEGGYKHTPEEMLSYLSTIGVYSGCKISEIDCPNIEEAMRRDFSDIGWVSAQIKGTRLIVNIVETEVPVLISENRKTDLKYAHIIAAKDGIVTNMIVRSGVPKVEIGSVVRRGEVLVSGVIPVIGDDGTAIKNKTVVADADIVLKTYVDYEYKCSMNYQYKQYSGKQKTGYRFEVWNQKIFSVSPSNSYEHYDIINDVNTLKLVRNFYLPFKITKSTVYEYTLLNATYTESEALEKANKELLRYLETLKKNGVVIVSQQVETKIENDVCSSVGRIIIQDSAWSYKEINDSEWRILKTDEHNGDNN